MNTNTTIAVLGSHSALDVCRGAKDEGFKTVVVCQKGREKTYNHYYKTDAARHPELDSGSQGIPDQGRNDENHIGCIDECLILDKFIDILKPEVQKKLIKKNVIFVPHRSFEVYLNFDYPAIEKKFKVPMFGNRFLLKIEERGIRPNQYDLLKKANIRFPKQFINPKGIGCLSLVKVSEKERGFERAFFLVEDYSDYKKQIRAKLKQGIFTQKQLESAVIEEFIVGVQVNLNFFYSPIYHRLELLGTDTRRQTNFEGITRIPVSYQQEVLNKIPVKYEEAGHIAVTVLESMLEDAFELGERFVKASQKLYPPGIIGPFALQSIIIPGPPKKEFVVVDVSPRVPGSPGISSTPYTNYLFGQSMSVGRRIAIEIKEATRFKSLKKILT